MKTALGMEDSDKNILARLFLDDQWRSKVAHGHKITIGYVPFWGISQDGETVEKALVTFSGVRPPLRLGIMTRRDWRYIGKDQDQRHVWEGSYDIPKGEA